MKKIVLILLFFIQTTVFSDNSSPVKIVIIGDSITQGGIGHPSFRRNLWFKLKNAGFNVDFVGSHNTFEGDVPNNQQDFDLDNEGHWAWEAGEIDNKLNTWLQAYTADIALIHAGTNDVDRGQGYTSTVNEISSIIAKLRNDNPQTIILLAKIIPMKGKNTAAFNNKLETWALAHSTAASPIVIIDQHTGYDPDIYNHDKWHPNEFGEERMATKWFAGLEPFLNEPEPIAENQTISFSPPTSKVLGDKPFRVTATASSRLVVTITSKTPRVCTIRRNIVTLIKAGACRLKASQAGNKQYKPAPEIIKRITISKSVVRPVNIIPIIMPLLLASN